MRVTFTPSLPAGNIAGPGIADIKDFPLPSCVRHYRGKGLDAVFASTSAWRTFSGANACSRPRFSASWRRRFRASGNAA